MTVSPRSSVRRRVVLWLLIVLLLAGGVALYGAWRLLWQPNVAKSPYGPAYLYIRTGASYQAVLDSLTAHDLLLEPASFQWLAARRNYPAQIRPGRYLLTPDLGNAALLDKLMQDQQDTVSFTLDAFKYKPQLTRQISRQLEADSVELRRLLQDNAFLRRRYQLDTTTILTLFLPGPYRCFWNTPARTFLDSAAATHQRFWTAQRRQRADSLGLSLVEVHVLASIVQRETAKKEDKPLIAGVYLNRLRRGMRLQADPTLLWAIGNFGVKRVLNRDKLVDSPYNTYRHKGLPPGPITSANRQSLDAVLKPAAHRYLFFCARPDLSGFSDFAETYADHKRNARRYQHTLDSLGVKR
ncbi:endolytic transglycosylase MltG [Microvirga sp. STR05]|uniref:Endolytic murein transglycosylase n=1 Tax=Hymenobacter duratus TaxID=2771356 RepID=A0ABR8JGH0_9BACT|nr:endolytic transglycosylase MltG [Hymenobacter duratus]MBD2714793.1 endolytic transglycosylase MltG [Hymenobacter duratus]MBR7949698.1 endolytic transglycosylase MltG [Microvirga sp. STR05]